MATHPPTMPEFQKGVKHLSKQDPIMRKIIQEVGDVNYRPGGDPFEVLVCNVVSQLVSSAAADTVIRRMRARTENRIVPEVLLTLSQEEFRALGIGAQKYGYISKVAAEFQAAPERFAAIHTLSDAEVLKLLTGLPGIGKWTAQMFLMFCLGRMDVFAPDDLGLRNAMLRYYQWEGDPTRKELAAKAAEWAPYRTVASVYLWNSIRKWE